MKKEQKDIRTLCYKCKIETMDAGYKLIQTSGFIKTECDKCEKQGFDYILKKRSCYV